MSSEMKRIRNSFTGVDFHSFPWLLKCHRVSWFECKVAQPAPKLSWTSLMIDNKTHTPAPRPARRLSTSGPLTAVDPWPDLGRNATWKHGTNISSTTSAWDVWVHSQISVRPHVCYLSHGCFEPIRLNEFVVVVVVDCILIERCHRPRGLPLGDRHVCHFIV